MAHADVEVMRAHLGMFVDEQLPDLDPVIAHETTSSGWRGLTAQGEVLEVRRPSNGHDAEMPAEIVVARDGVPVGRRAVRNDHQVKIDDYLDHFNKAVASYRVNDMVQALSEADKTMVTAPTLRARFNRAIILLGAGRWDEGFEQYWRCEQEEPLMRPQARAALDAGLRPWRGEDLHGKRILVMHAHGFGDSIMMLRYVPILQVTGAEVVLMMPPELERLAAQHAMVTPEFVDADFFCPILHLLHWLHVGPEDVTDDPYLKTDLKDVMRWHDRIGQGRNIGVAWSVKSSSFNDYPRAVGLERLVASLPGGAEIHSVQAQDAEDAAKFGVKTYTFADFADCAALMMCMDAIVSVDTAALHLAGAIGHPRVSGLLSYWHSWRWLVPWYMNVKLCRQRSDCDWSSVLAQI